MPSGKYISIGNIKMEYDATNKALKITNTTTNEVANLYTSGGISAYGVGTSSSSGGGLNGSVKSYSDALKLTSESLSEIASAYSIKQLSARITSLEGGSATSISVSGSGNAVTSVTKNGTTISVVKGSTFLTSHQSLAGYATQDWVNAKGYITSSGSITGNAATATHASSADYIRSNGLPAPANNTVKAYKDSLVKFFKDFYPDNGVGANVTVSASIIRNWSDDSATFYSTSSYCFIKIGGAYRGTQYGQFLLSTYNLDRVGIVGRTDDKWTAIKWLAYTDDIPKNNNQLTNGAGYITSAGSCSYATSAGSANSVAWANVSGRPTKVSQFTNDSGYITSSASITGNAATATKLQTARTIWGQTFDGTANVSGNLTGVDNITMSNNSYLYGKNTGGTAIQLIAMASWNSVDIGRGALTNGYTTQVMGKTVTLTASNDSGKNVKSVELSTAKLYSNVTIETEGGLLAHGGVTAYQTSDERLKHDIHIINCLDIVREMGGTVAFRYNADNSSCIGWIAQRVLQNPHLKDIVETDEKGYYKINYWSPKLIATAFGAIEQVGDEVSRLKARVVFLESEVQRLSGKQDGSNKKRLDNKNINSLN